MNSTDKILAFPNLEGIDATAAEWIVKIDAGEMTAQEYAAFSAWRDASEQHRDAFERLSVLWGAADELEVLNDYAEADKASEILTKTRNSAITKRVFLTGAVPAGMLAAGAAAFSLQPGLFRRTSGTFKTVVGQQKTITLADGSKLELNTNSEVRVTYTELARTVRLVRGELFSDVQSDKNRPFSVVTDMGSVTAVGTSFSVRVREDKVDVMVAEGRVTVAPGGDAVEKAPLTPQEIKPLAASASHTEVDAGYSAVFDTTVEQVVSLEPQVMARKLLWRDGLLAFSDDPLSEVVEDVSRYTEVSIEIADQDLRDLPVAGYFRVGDIDAMFDALEVMAGLRAEWVDSKTVVLSRNAVG